MLDKQDRKLFIAYVFGHSTGHNHKVSLTDLQVICDQALTKMNEPITTREDLEVLETIANTMWYSSHVEGLNREIIRKTQYQIE